ncbi:MAG: hypothetical protein HGA96_01200 [Desulfobulbaceae bacterium]|nr:hypothetical protein [Desulfobulbaceae bacterium]
MNVRTLALTLSLVVFPAVAQAFPPAGDFSAYWSEPESQAYISLDNSSYEISGRYVAVLTFEENPQNGNYLLIGELYDCAELQYSPSERVGYDADNHEISSDSIKNTRKSFKPIEEDSRQEFLLVGVCDEGSGKPYDLATVRKYFKMIATSLAASNRTLNR